MFWEEILRRSHNNIVHTKTPKPQISQQSGLKIYLWKTPKIYQWTESLSHPSLLCTSARFSINWPRRAALASHCPDGRMRSAPMSHKWSLWAIVKAAASPFAVSPLFDATELRKLNSDSFLMKKMITEFMESSGTMRYKERNQIYSVPLWQVFGEIRSIC